MEISTLLVEKNVETFTGGRIKVLRCDECFNPRAHYDILPYTAFPAIIEKWKGALIVRPGSSATGLHYTELLRDPPIKTTAGEGVWLGRFKTLPRVVFENIQEDIPIIAGWRRDSPFAHHVVVEQLEDSSEELNEIEETECPACWKKRMTNDASIKQGSLHISPVEDSGPGPRIFSRFQKGVTLVTEIYNHRPTPSPEEFLWRGEAGMMVLEEKTDISHPEHPVISLKPGEYEMYHPRPRAEGID